MSNMGELKAKGLAVARSPKTRKWGIRAAIAVAVFGLLGFFAAPPLVKHLVQQQASAELHRPVTVDRVRINPYALSVTIEGLKILDREGGQPDLSVASIYANAELMSIWRGAPVIGALRIEKPQLRLVRLSANKYNVSDVIDAFLAKPAGPTPRFALFNIEVVGGEVHFDDRVVDEKHVVSEIALRLPFISSLPAFVKTEVDPAFSALIDGAPLSLKGSTRPFDESLESEFALEIDRFNLAKLNDYLPAQLPLGVGAGTLDGEVRLTFRQHASKPAAITAAGHLLFQGLDLRDKAGKPFAAVKAIDITLQEADLLHQQIKVGKVAVEGLAVQSQAAGKEALRVKSAVLQEATVDLNKRTVVAKQLDTQGLEAQLARLADGNISFVRTLPLPASTAKAPEPQAASWQVNLAKLKLNEAQFQFEDGQTRPAASQTLIVDVLEMDNLSTAAAQAANLQLQARLNRKGEIKAQGSVQLAPLQAEIALEATGIELLPLQPYFNEKVSLTVTRGQIAAKGALSVRAGAGKDAAPSLAYKGNLTLGEFGAVDRFNAIEFLRWKSLYFGTVDVQSSPLNVNVGEVALSDFYSRLVISREGKLNLLQLLRPVGAQDPAPAVADAPASPPVEGQEAAVQPVTPPAATSAASAPAAPVTPVQIGKVTLQGGTINFTDNFIKPNYSTRLTRIGGRINGLSSAPESVADLDLRGSIDNLAPITIAGKINPLAAKPTLDIKAEVKGVDMTPFSPYAAKYAGYGIEKGKLSLFVTYKITNQQLQADNRLFLDQLTFSEEAVGEGSKLPVKLALALLKNRNGEVDINLPISGSLDDPQFSLGGIIGKVILNIFVKVVTSPFALIGSIFGGSSSEELASMEFEPGRTTLNAAGKTKLENIAKVLTERPALKLEVEGNVDLDVDREGYKHALLDRKVRRVKQSELTQKGVESSLADIQIDPKEYPDLLDKAYRAESFPKPRNLIGLVKSLPVEEMEKLIIANTQVSDDDLRDLANRRAQRVRDFLVNQANVPTERIFLVPPKFEKADGKKSDAPKGNRVDFSLR